MHQIAEIVMPPTADVKAAITQIMDYFREEQEDGSLGDTDWWDFWKIGGRFSGHKVKAMIGAQALEEFQDELIRREITVHPIRAGKPVLEPASQQALVDALWRERFPGYGDRCILFAHARDQYLAEEFHADDICTVYGIPDSLTCHRLIVAIPAGGDEQNPSQLYPVRMLVQRIWNGVEWQQTLFDGRVKPALEQMRQQQRDKKWRGTGSAEVGDDWLVVTVDYHH